MSSTPDAVPGHDEPRHGEHRTDEPRTDEHRTDVTHPGGPGPDDAAHPVSPARRRRLLRLVAVLAVAVLAVDQATKAWAVATLTEGVRDDVIDGLLGLTLLRNPGAALSIATGMTWLLTVVAVVVVVVTVRASRRIGSRAWAVALGLLLGGAVGNLVDRFLREPGPGRGHVVDFIAYGDLFVGNVADIAIVGAAGLIVLLALRGIGLDGTRERVGDATHRPGHPAHRAEPVRRVGGVRQRSAAAPTEPGDRVTEPLAGPGAGTDPAEDAPVEDRLRG